MECLSEVMILLIYAKPDALPAIHQITLQVYRYKIYAFVHNKTISTPRTQKVGGQMLCDYTIKGNE